MQTLDCRNYKELLDSYLSDELAVETNHAVQRHAELCPPCRQEMAARRNLRSTLRGAVTATTASPDFQNRLRKCLRDEAAATRPQASPAHRLAQWFRQLVSPQFALAAACGLVLLGLAYIFLPSSAVQAAALSPQIMQQAAGDHDHCAAVWRQRLARATDPVIGAESYDPMLQDLSRYSPHEGLGLTFHYAHVCGQYGRKHAHLVYSRGSELISLFVTERNAEALKNGVVPPDDGLRHGLQHVQGVREKFAVSAYQTSNHVVLLVSTLSAENNNALAEALAQPISTQLRLMESKK